MKKLMVFLAAVVLALPIWGSLRSEKDEQVVVLTHNGSPAHLFAESPEAAFHRLASRRAVCRVPDARQRCAAVGDRGQMTQP